MNDLVDNAEWAREFIAEDLEVARVHEEDIPAATGWLARPKAWFKDLPMWRKIRWVFSALLVPLLLVFTILGFGLLELHERYLAHTTTNNAAIAAADLRSSAGEMRYNAVRFILRGDAEAVQRAKSTQMRAHDEIQVLRSQFGNSMPEFQAKVDMLDTQLNQYVIQFERIQANIANGAPDSQTETLSHGLAAHGDALYSQTQELKLDLIAYAATTEKDGVSEFFNVIALSSALVIFGLLSLIIGLHYLFAEMRSRYAEIIGSMQKLAQGDLSFEIRDEPRKDEIGDMMRALRVFKRAGMRMKSLMEEEARRAREELEVKKKLEKEREENLKAKQALLSDFADNFERTVGDIVTGVATASSQLKSTADSMAGSADLSSSQSSMVACAMEEVSEGVTAAATASDDFAVSIAEISNQAENSAALARKASDTAGKADETISALTISATQVGDIVELIHSIAKRTNLLALNASIEAARGGEAGRGFAVVAAEVKELAAQTSRATEEISSQIKSMQGSTENSATALRLVGEQIEQLELAAISIASAVGQQSNASQDLAGNLDLAARSSGEVAGGVENVSEAAIATGAAASQVLTSATNLENQAASLRDQVGHFLSKVRSN